MYGVYAWNAGAAQANIFADIAALVCGAQVADLSAACNKAASSTAGAASGWAALDAANYVIRRDGQAGGPGMQAQIGLYSVSLGMRCVEAWNVGTHAAGSATAYQQCGGALAGAGKVFINANDAGVSIAAVDYSTYAIVGEVKRDNPAFAGDAAAPGSFVLTANNYAYMPRIKNNAAAGDVTAAGVSFMGAYGSMVAAAAKRRDESPYMPMVPATIAYSSFPVGEVNGIVAAGGYGVSGDVLTDDAAQSYTLFKSSVIVAFPKK